MWKSLTLLLITLNSCSQIKTDYREFSPPKKITSFSIGFYNVENLFDTIDDPEIIDEEYLPSSEKKWNTEKYNQKLENLSKVISSENKKQLPLIVGLCEIENQTVIKDLVNQPSLKKGEYEYIHYDSPDQRGIDVGLIYQKKYASVNASKKINVALPEGKPTRDILMVELVLYNFEKLYVFVNHWPSRRGGEEESEINRITAAKTLKKEIDALLKKDSLANILIIGDFNDTPLNNSVLNYLEADTTISEKQLFNVSYSIAKKNIGTHNYQGEWSMLDQVIVSKNMVSNNSKLRLKENQVNILNYDWMMYEHPKYKDLRPNRTYSGNTYHAGYSDHLPTFIHLINK